MLLQLLLRKIRRLKRALEARHFDLRLRKLIAKGFPLLRKLVALRANSLNLDVPRLNVFLARLERILQRGNCCLVLRGKQLLVSSTVLRKARL